MNLNTVDYELPLIVATICAVLIIFVSFIFIVANYKKCPSDKIMVIYGKTSLKDGKNSTFRCLHGGAAFVWPIVQSYMFLELAPIPLKLELDRVRTKDRLNAKIASRFSVGISTQPTLMENAAQHLLGLEQVRIGELAYDIICGQIRLVVAEMTLEQLVDEYDVFLSKIASSVEAQIGKIGLRLININMDYVEEA